jgi:hypothetical protein
MRRGILAEMIRQALIRLAPGMMRLSGKVDNFARERERLTIYETLAIMDAVGDQERFMLETLKGLNLWERIGHPPGFAFGGLAVIFV